MLLVYFYRLISSDALARGMDIKGVDYVVLYSAPKSVKNYIHRIGRTGRAGRPGTAVTLLLEKQVIVLHSISGKLKILVCFISVLTMRKRKI